MPVKYIPYLPTTVEGQAILNNFVRTRRALLYNKNGEVHQRILRGLPLYETETTEVVGRAAESLLLRGECISACAYLKDRGIKVDLVYIDPPFASGADYAKKIFIRRNPKLAEVIKKAEEEMERDDLKTFEETIYGDIWKKENYLNWMYENLQAIKSVMSETASIYVHLDAKIGYYVRVLLDEIFGENCFRNEIVWWYYNKMQGNVGQFPSNHDVIYWYSKSQQFVFNPQFEGRNETTKQIKRVWDKEKQKLVNAKNENGSVVYQESNTRTVDDVWKIAMLQPADKIQNVDYTTQKPEALLERIIETSSNEGMVVADFFGGSGVTAAIAHKLKRKFIHADVGINSLQTTRDRLKAVGASFTVLDIKDGVSLFRNPQQTMDKLKSLIQGLRNEDGLDCFWEGAIQDSKDGMIPVYVPNLLDHSTKLLDKAAASHILLEALPDLPEDVKKVIVYYVDVDDRAAIETFMDEENNTAVKIELRDLKEVLDQVVVNDEVDFTVSEGDGKHTIAFHRFTSDRLLQKIAEYNAKKSLGKQSKKLMEEDAEEEAEEAPAKKQAFKPIHISDEGLELIEFISLDCTTAEGPWKSDEEIKIDKNGYIVSNGAKTKDFWNGTITSTKNHCA